MILEQFVNNLPEIQIPHLEVGDLIPVMHKAVMKHRNQTDIDFFYTLGIFKPVDRPYVVCIDAKLKGSPDLKFLDEETLEGYKFVDFREKYAPGTMIVIYKNDFTLVYREVKIQMNL